MAKASSQEDIIRSKLKEQTEEIEMLYDASSDAIMRLDPPDWRFTAGNPATLKIFGVKNEHDFLELSPWDLSPEIQPDGKPSLEKAKEMIEKAVIAGSNFFEWTHKKYNGENFIATVLLVRIGVGDNMSLRAVVRDVSLERKEREILRQFIEKTKTKLTEVVPIIGEIVVPKEPEEPAYLLSVMSQMVNILKERNVHLENVRTAMFSLAEDLSSEKQKLEESKAEVETIISSIGEAIVVVDELGAIIVFNPAAERISGFTKEEALGKNYGEILRFYSDENEKTPHTFIDNALSSGEIRKLGVNGVLEQKGGKRTPVIDNLSLLFNLKKKKNGCVISFSDVSLEREIESAKTEFVSLASHQLRTPISAESWFIEMLLSGEVGELNPKQRDYMEELEYLNKRLGNIVSMLLNVSRIEMGTFIVDPLLISIDKVISDSLVSSESLFEKKKLTFEKRIDNDLPLVCADPKLLGIVVDNLLSNAINYTPSGGHIIVSVTKDKVDMKVQIADNGIGIPFADQPKMFKKLFRADNAKVIDTDGTGIGLFMTKSIIERWEGKIDFVSPLFENTNSGTAFTFTIPLLGMKKKEGKVILSKQ